MKGDIFRHDLASHDEGERAQGVPFPRNFIATLVQPSHNLDPLMGAVRSQFFRQFLFLTGLWYLPTAGCSLDPDLGQEVLISTVIKDQLRLLRSFNGRDTVRAHQCFGSQFTVTDHQGFPIGGAKRLDVISAGWERLVVDAEAKRNIRAHADGLRVRGRAALEARGADQRLGRRGGLVGRRRHAATLTSATLRGRARTRPGRAAVQRPPARRNVPGPRTI